MNSNESSSDTNPSAAPDLWSPPSNGIVKLRYGSEVRRIPVQRLLNDKHQFAYKKLFTLTQDFLSIEHTGFTTKNSNKLPQVVFTYTDDDGDVVTMSSRSEFLEAWQHMGGDVLRLTAVIKGSSSANNKQATTIEKETQSEGSSSSSGASSFGGAANHDLIAPMTLQSLLETIMAMVAKFIQSIQASGNARNGSSPSLPSNSSSNSTPFPSTCNVGVNAAVVTDEIVERIVEEMKNMKQARREAWRAKSLITDPEKLDPSFVHYRHTCDGCGVRPIVGLRYHALNKDNYDLCKACFDANDEKHKDIVFEAQQYNHDAGKCGWRKKKKWEAMKAAAWANANANGHPPPPPHHHHGSPPHPHGGPPPHHHHHGPPPPPPHHHHGPPPPHFGPPPPHHHPHPHGKHGMMWAMMQEDLKSAIERSLADVMEKTTSAEDNSKPSDDVEVEVKGKGVEETKTNDDIDNDISKENEVNQVEPSTSTAAEKKMEEEEIIVKAAADEEGSWNMIDEDHQEDASSPNISTTLLARWDTELAALAELGFIDTKAVLDALETLQAANIGCESEEDGVSLQKVVDYLLKQQQQH